MGIIQTIKDAVSVAQKAGNIPLHKLLLATQKEALDLVEEIKKKDKTIEQLEEALAFKGKLVHREPAYYQVDESRNLIDGPFCTKCFDVDHVICRLVRAGGRAVMCQKCRLRIQSIRPVHWSFGPKQ